MFSNYNHRIAFQMKTEMGKNLNGMLIDNYFFVFKNNAMKKIKSWYSSFMAIVFLLLAQIAIAQDSAVSSTTSTTTTSSSSFTVQPWMWIVGGIIVLIIIIALVSGGSKEKVVITKERTIE